MYRRDGEDTASAKSGSVRSNRDCFGEDESNPGSLDRTRTVFDEIDINHDNVITRAEVEQYQDRKAKPNSRHALRDQGAGANHGYHGLRLPEGPRNVRLFGSAPCMRSSVDEVVFSRDMDQSGGDGAAQSAEMEHLVKCFVGGAGQKDAMADLMGCATRGEKPRCVKMYGVQGGIGASQIDEVIYGRDLDFEADSAQKDVDWLSHAGLKGKEPFSSKRIWPHGATHTSVGQVCFGQKEKPITEKDERFIAEHYNHSGGTSLFFSRPPGAELGKPEGKKMGKRIFKNAPMNASVMERVIHNKPNDLDHDSHLMHQFQGAAGTSVRYDRARCGQSTVKQQTDNVVCIHR